MIETIDLHHHARPDAFWDALSKRGYEIHGGRPLPPRYRPNEVIEMMGRVGMSAAVLSAPDADLAFAERDFGMTQARNINEFFAEIIRSYPSRFGGLACLPMPHMEESLKELEYALDTLGLDGLQLLSSYEGDYLGSAKFDPIFEECNRRGLVVLVHPARPLGMSAMKIDIPSFVLEFVNDTTRCVANFLMNDVSARYPKIKFIFGHAGGTAPFLASRLSLIDLFGNPKNKLSIPEARKKALHGLRQFYYDTALSVDDPVLQLLSDVVGVEHVVFGSDYPQAKEDFVKDTIDGVVNSAVLSAESRYAVARGNGLKLFPRFRTAADELPR